MRVSRGNTASLAVVAVMAGLFHADPSHAQQTDQTQSPAAQTDLLGQQATANQARPAAAFQSWKAFPTTNLFSPPTTQQPGLTPASELPPPYLAKFSASAKESFTDNVYLTSSQRKADSVTSLNPTVDLSARSKKIDAGLNYSGGYDRYASNTRLDGFRHNGMGIFTGELIDQQLFLDSRGSVSEQNIDPTSSSTTGSRTSPNSQVRVLTYQAGPRLQERLGTWGVAQISATHSRTVNERLSSSSSSETQNSTAEGSLGGTTTNRGGVEVRNGQSFTSLLWDYSSNFSQSTQSTAGTLGQASHQLGVEYRLNSDWGLLASSGYDSLHGEQVNSKYSGVFYNGGLHWTPSPNTDIRGGGGWRYGQSALFGLLNYKLGPRTSIRASHDVGITSDAQNLFDSLSSVQRDEQGNYVNPFSGLKADPAASLFQRSNAIYRQETTSASINHDAGRDAINLSGSLSKRQIISGPQTAVSTLTGAQLANSSTTASASITWTHQLSHQLSTVTTITGDDVVQASAGSSKSKTGTGKIGVNYLLNSTLSTEVSYRFSDTKQPAGTSTTTDTLKTGTIIENLVYISLKKTF